MSSGRALRVRRPRAPSRPGASGPVTGHTGRIGHLPRVDHAKRVPSASELAPGGAPAAAGETAVRSGGGVAGGQKSGRMPARTGVVQAARNARPSNWSLLVPGAKFLNLAFFVGDGGIPPSQLDDPGGIVTLRVPGGAAPGPPPLAAEEVRRLRWREPLALLHATSRAELDAWRSRVKELSRHILTRLPGFARRAPGSGIPRSP